MRVLVIDNYDSFTYNLVQYLGELGAEVEVVRNDAAEVEDLLRGDYDRVVVSPGPCTPDEAGISVEAIREFATGGVPVLGVCLGHQSMVQAFGGSIVQGEPIHGKEAKIEHDGKTIYEGLPSPLTVGRYHSLIAGDPLPDQLEVSSSYGDIVMGVRHNELPAEGVQFHPESVLTPDGKKMVARFIGADVAGLENDQAAGTSENRAARPAAAARTETKGTRMPNEILTRAIDAVASGNHLTADHASAVLSEIMEGRAGEVQTGAFLIALRTKGETVPELVGLARTMRGLSTPVECSREDLVDTAGTGGGPSTFNVSTTAALVAAGAGCAMAKHGNRSNTSLSGSADLLEALGVEIGLGPGEVARQIDEIGFGFMFAPNHHQAMKHVVPVRKELAVRTIFNFLGPLTNPAGAKRQVIGVSDRSFQETIAEAVAGLGAEHALVVSADDGLDEVSISGPTRIIEVVSGSTREIMVSPEDFDMKPAGLGEVAGGTPEQNADATRAVLAGEVSARRDLVLLNAAAAIRVAGRAEDFGTAVVAAATSIDSGSASSVLDRLVAFGAAR